MNFHNEELRTGGINTTHWISDCGEYSIAMYEYYCSKPCMPYYAGYLRSSGSRITSHSAVPHIFSFDHCAERVAEWARDNQRL